MSGGIVMLPGEDGIVTPEQTGTVTLDPRTILANKLKERKKKSMTNNKQENEAIQQPLSMVNSKDQTGVLADYLQLPMPI